MQVNKNQLFSVLWIIQSVVYKTGNVKNCE